MHHRLFTLFLASSPDTVNQESTVEKDFDAFAFSAQIVVCLRSKVDMNIKVFSLPCVQWKSLSRSEEFFQFLTFVWQLFSALNSSDIMPVTFFCLSYPVTNWPAVHYVNESTPCKELDDKITAWIVIRGLGFGISCIILVLQTILSDHRQHKKSLL